MLAVWGGHQPHNHITAALHFLDLHCPRQYLLPVLEHLKRNRITGKALHEFILGECQGRLLEFQRKMLEKVKREPGLILVAGSTFK